MDRRHFILKMVDRDGLGLEIGPCHSPITPKREGFKVEIIDHLSREQLVERYEGHGVNLDKIEDVDYVWSGQEGYAELTNKRDHYDWIVSSHNIEHTPDLIRFLNDCSEVLKDDGILSLVIPDKRFSFDHFRSLTSIGDVVDAQLRGDTIHSPGKVLDYCMNVVSRNGQIGWSKRGQGEYKLIHKLSTAQERMARVIEEGHYFDIHNWCFTPSSFRLLINDLNELGYISMQELDYTPTYGCEFYITLGNVKPGAVKLFSREERLAMMQEVDKELEEADGFQVNNNADNQSPTIQQQMPSLLVRVKNRLKRMLKAQLGN